MSILLCLQPRMGAKAVVLSHGKIAMRSDAVLNESSILSQLVLSCSEREVDVVTGEKAIDVVPMPLTTRIDTCQIQTSRRRVL